MEHLPAVIALVIALSILTGHIVMFRRSIQRNYETRQEWQEQILEYRSALADVQRQLADWQGRAAQLQDTLTGISAALTACKHETRRQAERLAEMTAEMRALRMAVEECEEDRQRLIDRQERLATDERELLRLRLQAEAFDDAQRQLEQARQHIALLRMSYQQSARQQSAALEKPVQVRGELEHDIREAYRLINEYRDRVREEGDPRQKSYIRTEIETQTETIRDLLRQYASLIIGMGGIMDSDIAEIAAIVGTKEL